MIGLNEAFERIRGLELHKQFVTDGQLPDMDVDVFIAIDAQHSRTTLDGRISTYLVDSLDDMRYMVGKESTVSRDFYRLIALCKSINVPNCVIETLKVIELVREGVYYEEA